MGTNLATTSGGMVSAMAPYIPYLLGAGLVVSAFKAVSNWFLGKSHSAIH
jgi:hypothetical protein